MTIRQALQFARDFLGASKSAILDSEVLLMHASGMSKEHLFSHDNEDLDDDLFKLFKQYLQRLQSGEPVAYITNEKEFFGFDFYVDKRVLVPRPETEELVKIAVDFLNAELGMGKHGFKLLDVGTGSANIPVAICKNFENIDEEVISQFDAIDVSDEALSVARINVEQNSLCEVVSLFQSDLLEALDDFERYDVITSNLPYIATDGDKKFVAENVEENEPALALFAGNDGLDLYRKLFQQISDKKIDFSLFVGEFGFGQTAILQDLLEKYFSGEWQIVKDFAGIDRFFLIKKHA